ncbi:hypothetical protein ACH4D5_38625 [Streptomyces sp. NPDC018029]|uniref:hypothetical protein n=1 Tax=Streptomyces sp. NPDC018029 TaxID=3365032 RepID=UPI0037A8ADF4
MSGIAAPGTGARVPSRRYPGDDGTTGAAPRPRTGDSAVRNGIPRRSRLLPAAGRQGGGMAAGPALLAW